MNKATLVILLIPLLLVGCTPTNTRPPTTNITPEPAVYPEEAKQYKDLYNKTLNSLNTKNTELAEVNNQLQDLNNQLMKARQENGPLGNAVDALNLKVKELQKQLALSQNQTQLSETYSGNLTQQLTVSQNETQYWMAKYAADIDEWRNIANLGKTKNYESPIIVTIPVNGEVKLLRTEEQYPGYFQVAGTATLVKGGYVIARGIYEGKAYSCNQTFFPETDIVIPALPGLIEIFFGNSTGYWNKTAELYISYVY
jgi:hypothetical protein